MHRRPAYLKQLSVVFRSFNTTLHNRLGNLGSNALKLGGATGIAHIILMAASPILTRIYDESHFGTMTVFTSIAAVASIVSTLRYELAIPLPDKDSDAANVFAVGAISLCVSCIILLLISASCRCGRLVLPLERQLGPYLWLIPLSVLMIGTYQLVSFWMVRSKDFGTLGKSRIQQSLTQVTAQVTMGLAGWGPFGLIIADSIGRLIGSISIMSRICRRSRTIISCVSWRTVHTAAIRYCRFSSFGVITAAVDVFVVRAPLLAFAAIYGLSAAGFLELAYRLIGAPTALIGRSVGNAYFSEVSQQLHEDRSNVAMTFSKVVLAQSAVGALIVTFVLLPAPWLCRHVFGQNWITAGEFARLLSIKFFFEFLANPIAFTFDALERKGLQLALVSIQAILVAVAVFLARNSTPTAMLTAISVATALGYCLILLGTWSLVRGIRQCVA